jgi:hypothetical protein
MDQINEALDRLSELSDEELSGVEGNILSEFDALEGGDTTPESVKAMTKLADALENVRSEIGTRAQAAEELFAAKEAAASRIAQFAPPGWRRGRSRRWRRRRGGGRRSPGRRPRGRRTFPTLRTATDPDGPDRASCR